MKAYDEVYLSEVVETQGKLFDYVSYAYKGKNTEDFIIAYMNSDTRKFIDQQQAYVNTMDYRELLEYFLKNDSYVFVDGDSMEGFMPAWIGEFYAYYQWYYNLSSSEVVKCVPLEFLKKAYYGLHDLELDLAVKKVGKQ